MRRNLRFWLLSFVLLASAAPSDPAWRIIGPGGGGAMFYPTISPHDPRTVLVGCDMTGAYLTRDGGQTWRIINLGQPPQFFVFDPIDAKVIYAKADGLFRTREKKRKRYLHFYQDEHPISAQLFGSDAYTLSESAKIVEAAGC